MLHLQFSPFPTLETERLLLRAVTINDAANIMAIRNHATVNKYIHGRAPLKNIEESKARIVNILNEQQQKKVILWCICLKEEPQNMLGSIVFWNIEPENDLAEIGYELHPEHHNKGIMSESVKKILVYGKEIMRLKKITAYTHKNNLASIRMLQSNDFQRDFGLENIFVGKTEPETQTIYTLNVK